MVRHEAAEALGAIGGSDIEEVLSLYRRGDKDKIVVESCEVALDAMNYWETNFAT
jgi:deoxyhypusine monooxygenase